MASVISDPGGKKRIQFIDPDGKRKTVRLGACDKKTAESVCRHIEALLSAKLSGQPPPRQTAQWLGAIGQTLHDRLARVGLVVPKARTTLGQFLEDWIAKMNVKPASKAVRGLVVKDLLGFFGADYLLADITTKQAEDFHQSLISRGLRPMTIAKRIEHARTAFKQAVRLGLLERSPFEFIHPKAGNPSERWQYVPAEMIVRLLDYCPNWTWRTLLVLARFAGLRTPSEPFSLKWTDVLWEEGKLLIDSPKTGLRAMPLFPIVRKTLEEAFELAEPGSVFVIPESYRKRAMGPAGFRNANLRTTLLKIIRRAGETPWPRLWHNLRASCETDLVSRYPLPTAAKWLGNSSMIAYRHYVSVTDQTFQQAVQEDPFEMAQKAAQKAAH